jgi:conjugative relaxase-like TrwC/TraI family protein
MEVLMVATIAAGTAAGYYLKQAEYYLGGREPAGRWISRTGDFSVENGEEVGRAQFERLHAGLGDDGQLLLSNTGDVKQRVAGYDLTLSAPKSVSIIYALAEPDFRKRIEAAQQRAVEATIKLLDGHAAFGRRGKNGLQLERVSLTVASFRHGEARPVEHDDGRIFADPNLHTHNVILNTAVRADGTIGALDGRFLFNWKMASGAAYHAALASEMQALGFLIADEIGKNGTFEVAGVPQEMREYFSARRREIEESISKEGATTAAAPALAAAIALSSRSSKATDPSIERFDLWRNEAARFGIEPERFVSSLRRQGQELDTAGRDRMIAERMAALPRQLTENESVFEKRHLYAAVASGLVGTGAGAERIEDEVAALVAHQAIVELSRDDLDQPLYSTPEMVRIERELVTLTHRLSRRQHAAPDPKHVAALCKNRGLSAEQTAVALAATDRRSIAIAEGAPGSGKTTMLKPIVDAYRHAGMRVIGSATAWRIANQLRDDLGIESKATDAWIASARAGRWFLDRNSVLVVDESGLLSSRQMHAVLSEVAQVGAKAILVGDRGQLQAIGAGPGLQIVASVVEASRVDTIVRQRQAWARQAVMDAAKGRVAESLNAFAERGLITACDGSRTTVRALVDAWQRAHAETHGISTILIAKSNAQVRTINDEVRSRLQLEGQIHGREIKLSAVTASGHTQSLLLAAGDSIRFLARQDALGVINGSVATIDKIQGANSNPRIKARIGDRKVSFTVAEIADEAGRARLTHAYASTIYGAQGLTVDQAFVLISPTMNRHDLVVASSRGRDRTEHFIDNREVDAQIRAGLPLSDRRSAQIKVETRLGWLATRLSRMQVKTCTLDPTLALAEQSRVLARERSRGLDRD